MKVGIITLPFEANYGWAVQMWALYHTIEKLGHEPIIIDRRWNIGKSSFLIDIKRSVYHKILCGRFHLFVDDELPNKTAIVRTTEETNAVTENLDAVIVGSDQVWRIENTRLAGFDFFLDFVKDNRIKRISYAASYGKDTWQGTEEETFRVKELLNKFDSVSVREDSGVVLCEDLFGVPAAHVLDPTLLLDASDYNSLLSKSQYRNEIVTYILDPDPKKTEIVNKIADRYEAKIVNLYPSNKYSIYKSIYAWLESIRNAKYVLVDSFHGMVFSILFHKQFAVIGNEKRGLARFSSLLEMLSMSDRMTTEISYDTVLSILEQTVDYEIVEERLSEARNKSMNFLVNSLGDA